MESPPVIRRLLDDHAHFYRVFRVLEHQLDLLSGEDGGADFTLLEDVIEYILAYPDSVHHPLEDRLFAVVLEKGVDARTENLILGNRDQHQEISASTKRLHTDIQHVLVGAVIRSDRLKKHVDDYIEAQRKHLSIEEQELFPLAERMLVGRDWKTLEDELLLREDPVFGKTSEVFSDLYRYIVEMDQAYGR